MIYKNAISDPSFGTDAVYELKATLRITASDGTFVMYSRASMDALTGPATQGTYYAAEFTPTLTAGGCTMTANYERHGLPVSFTDTGVPGWNDNPVGATERLCGDFDQFE